jgi:hypothetical protein
MTGSFGVAHGHEALVSFWFPLVGLRVRVFGLFTMYMPPLFPTLLRTTGAGFCYNIGRLVAAFGTVFFGWFAPVGDFRLALLADGALFGVAAVLALALPISRTDGAPAAIPARISNERRRAAWSKIIAVAMISSGRSRSTNSAIPRRTVSGEPTIA